MNMMNQIQSAINYIEENITDDIDYSVIAQKAASSTFYFQRIFSALCGMTIGEYIRSRRLSLAGNELAATDAKVIDIALKYGYDSPESFTRAFSKFHGITPSEAKKNGSRLKSFSRFSVQIILKGGSIMDYKIVKKEAFRVLEKVEQQSIVDSANLNTIPAFWERSHSDGTINTLLEHASDKSIIFGICYGNTHSDDKIFDYAIAVPFGGGNIPEGYSTREIPERTWIVFSVTGELPQAIQNTWHNICAEFFPTSSYTPTYEMDIEAYGACDYKSEIWVPIEAK